MKKILAMMLTAVMTLSLLTACGKEKEVKIDVDQPQNAATVDEPAYLGTRAEAVEDSRNVNGKRFTSTLYDFTSRYNAEMSLRGEKDVIHMEGWKKNGQVTKDENGIRIQYYYYDDNGMNITATVEEDSDKLVNIGCGTTMGHFVGKEDNGEKKSDKILLRAALVAQAVCGYPSGHVNTLQNIFYRITEENKTLWYDGFVFALNTREDGADSQNSLMLFRVFPVTDKLKEEWHLEEYQ